MAAIRARISESKAVKVKDEADAAQRDDDAALAFQQANPLPSANPPELKSALKKSRPNPETPLNKVSFNTKEEIFDIPLPIEGQFLPAAERKQDEAAARIAYREERKNIKAAKKICKRSLFDKRSGLFGRGCAGEEIKVK
jgi:hypothetical protein